MSGVCTSNEIGLPSSEDHSNVRPGNIASQANKAFSSKFTVSIRNT